MQIMAYSIPVTDLRAGTLFCHDDGQIYQVTEYRHVKIGRGGAVIKLKIQNPKSKMNKELTLKSGNKVEAVDGVRKSMEFVYLDAGRDVMVLADPETKKRSQVEHATSIVGDELKFLREGQAVQALKVEGELLSLEVPVTVELAITETSAGERGDTAGTARKPATLESGAVVQVPMFIKVGDVVKVNTGSGDYVERISQNNA